MKIHTKYRVHKHHKFEHAGRKYAADMESDAIVEINDVEWELLNCDLAKAIYVNVETLKLRFKVEQVFDGFERLESLSQRGHLLSPVNVIRREDTQDPEAKLKLLIPLEFALEKNTLDAVTTENRYHLLVALSKYAKLETINVTGEEIPEILDFVSVHTVEKSRENERNLPPVWYAGNSYDGILLLSQFLWEDTLYYLHETPILYCIESDRNLGKAVFEKTLEYSAVQKPSDLLLPKVSWLAKRLSEFGVDPAGMHTISEGINIIEPIGKGLAKATCCRTHRKPSVCKTSRW